MRAVKRKYTADGRIGKLVVRGKKVDDDQALMVLSGSIDLSLSQVSQIQLKLSDPSLTTLYTRLYDAPIEAGKKGSSLDYAGLKFEVAAVEVADDSGTAVLSVTGRSLGMQKLRRLPPPEGLPPPKMEKHVWKDPDIDVNRPGWERLVTYTPGPDERPPVNGGVGRNVSPTGYLKQQAKRVGLKFVGETSAVRANIGPVADPQVPGKVETIWQVAQRLAKELGFIVFEAAGTLYFGRPTWLLARAKMVTVEWKGRATNPHVLAVPSCRRTGDDPDAASVATVEVKVTGEVGDTVVPGMGLHLLGVPTFTGKYLITSVTIPLADDAAVTIKATTPENPVPVPATDIGGAGMAWGGESAEMPGIGTVLLPAPGKYADTDINNSQALYAGVIYRVGAVQGASQGEKIMALMTAMQESRLDNLSGGDRDSVGLFQQRPSQGWGTVDQIRDPVYASKKFYSALFPVSRGSHKDEARWKIIARVQRPREGVRVAVRQLGGHGDRAGVHPGCGVHGRLGRCGAAGQRGAEHREQVRGAVSGAGRGQVHLGVHGEVRRPRSRRLRLLRARGVGADAGGQRLRQG